jgi:hypothetical protein
MRLKFLVAVSSLMSLCAAAGARAQGTLNVTLRIHVTDSSGTRVPSADVAVTRGLKDVIAHGTTDASGDASLSIARLGDNTNIIVRKIGFNRADRFVRIATDSVIPVEIRLVRPVSALPTVSITAEESRKRHDYHLDADDLEKSGRPVIDGTDILKLRPEMLTSRAGWRTCGYIQTVWVNGVRVVLAPVDPVAVSRRSAFGIPAPRAAPARRRNASRSGTTSGPTTTRPNPAPIDAVLSILASIHPEHIAEVSFQDCLDNTVALNHSDMAMFISLKPGIAFEPGIGTYVLDPSKSSAFTTADSTTRRTMAAAESTVALRGRTADSASIKVADYPPYRFRVIGLFDDSTGGTVEGAEIIDTKSGLRALSSATGTTSLFFLPDGGSTILIRKTGLRDTTFFVPITPADTTPITLLLLRKP